MVDVAKKAEGWLDSIPFKWKILSLVGIFVLGALLYSLAVFTKWYPDDNPVEQTVEEIIKDETGVTVDLSPESQPATN